MALTSSASLSAFRPLPGSHALKHAAVDNPVTRTSRTGAPQMEGTVIEETLKGPAVASELLGKYLIVFRVV